MSSDEFDAQLARDEFRKRKDAANIPTRHDTPFGNRTGQEWRSKYNSVCKMLFERRGPIIAIIGPRGTGKTQLAVDACMLYMHKAKRQAYYTRAFDVFAAIKETYSTGEKERDVTDPLKRVPLLVVDEMQVRSDTAWENTVLTSMLDARYCDIKPTIMIANLEHDAFKEYIGASAYDRIVETGGVVVCKWESYR